MGDKEQLQHQSQNLLITARGHELAKLLLLKLSGSEIEDVSHLVFSFSTASCCLRGIQPLAHIL
jgi:hypothetical protein